MENSINQNNIKHLLSIGTINNIIYQFIEKDDIKSLSLCSKKLNEVYCNKIKKLKILTILKLLIIPKYKNLISLNLEGLKGSHDFSFISKIENLDELNLKATRISDISFLEKNKNLKKLNLSVEGLENEIIKDFSFISNLEKLEDLDLSKRLIKNIKFLAKNINLIRLDLHGVNSRDFQFYQN